MGLSMYIILSCTTVKRKEHGPAPIKLYLPTFSPDTILSSKKLYFESLAIRMYAIHGVKRSAGS